MGSDGESRGVSTVLQVTEYWLLLAPHELKSRGQRGVGGVAIRPKAVCNTELRMRGLN